jgi:tetratricopeptide (TPR) repeat protein
MTKNALSSLIDQAAKKYRSGQHLEAAQMYAQAAEQYVQNGDALMAAEMSNNRSVALLQAGDHQGALQASLDTDQVFAQAGDIRRQAVALGNQAAALEALNRTDEALKKYWQCSDLLKQAGDKDTRSHVLQSISTLQIRTGHHLEALATMEAALDNKKKLNLRENVLQKILRIPIQMVKRGG